MIKMSGQTSVLLEELWSTNVLQQSQKKKNKIKKKSKDVSVIVYPGEIAKATGQNISKQFHLEKNL